MGHTKKYTQKCNHTLSASHPGCVTFNPRQTITQEVRGRHRRAEFVVRPTGTNAHLLFHNLQGVPSWVDCHCYTITSKGRYNVIIKQRDIIRLPLPFKSKCYLTESLKNNGFPYSDSYCQEHCFASDMFDTCDAVTDFWEQYLPSANRKIDPQFNDRNQMERTRKCLGDFLYDYRARKPCECKMAREETMYRANIMKYEDRNDSTY